MLAVFQGLLDRTRLLLENVFFSANFNSFQVRKYLLKNSWDIVRYAHILIKLLKNSCICHPFASTKKTVKKYMSYWIFHGWYMAEKQLWRRLLRIWIYAKYFIYCINSSNLSRIFIAVNICRIGLVFRVKDEFANLTNRRWITSNPYHFLSILSFRVKYSLVWGQNWRDSPLK